MHRVSPRLEDYYEKCSHLDLRINRRCMQCCTENNIYVAANSDRDCSNSGCISATG